MSLAGKLKLCIVWDGNAVRDVQIKSTRPQAYRLLDGKSPDDVAQFIPLLYSVCGKAQQAAVIAAIAAARGNDMRQNAALERAVACEAMQEHLWRLLLDWPKLLDLPQQQEQFVRWHGELNAIASGYGNAENLRTELYRELLGVVPEWQHPDSYAGLSEWWGSVSGLCAAVFAALDRKERTLDFVGEVAANTLMPEWHAADVLRTFAGCFNHEFAAMPQHDGRPLETGMLAYHYATPLLQDILHNRPSALQARLFARVLDLLDSVAALTQGNSVERIQGVSAPDGEGVSVVKTARGMLMHHVRIEMGRVAEYLIIAPTEWNFHPQGALASGLLGLKQSNEERLMETVRHYVLSLDPCVEYEIEVAHA